MLTDVPLSSVQNSDTPHFTELVTQCRHCVLYIDQRAKLSFPLIIGQTTLIQQAEPQAVYFERFLSRPTMQRQPYGWLDPQASLHLFGISRDSPHEIIWPWSICYQNALQQLAEDELYIDQYARPLPRAGARQLYVAQRRELLWRNTQDLADWFFLHQWRWPLHRQ